METVICNGKVVLPDRVIDGGYVKMRDGLISGVGKGEPGPVDGDSIDAAGGWISPGLCDMHLHGCGGYWGFFGADDTLNMARALAKNGVTSFVPATVSLPHDQVLNAIDEVRKAMNLQPAGPDFATAPERAGGARILGLHLEGPYINPELSGAHIPLVIRPPAKKEVDEILDRGADMISIVTLAPEIDGGMEFIERLHAANILVSVGHSNATSEQTREAIGRGARHFTHLFNAMRKFHHREPGCAFTAIVDPRATIEIILDTRHVHTDAAATAIRAKSPDRTALVTDSILAAGLGDGKYNVWGFDVFVKNGLATLENGTIAGSAITLNETVKNAIELLDVSPHDAFSMASRVPLGILGHGETAGTLAEGRPADIAVFDDAFKCTASFIGGRQAHPKP